jgi:hypothetical protein
VFASGGTYGSCSAFRCVWALKCRCTIFYGRVRPVRIQQKACQDTLRQTSVFHLVAHAGHVVHFVAFGLQNINALFVMLGWARCGFHKKCTGTRYAELVLLHPLGYVGHVVNSGASGPQNITHYFMCSGGTDVVSMMSTGRRYSELVFLHPFGSAGHVVHSGASGLRNIDVLFFMLGWARCGFHKKHTRTRYVELLFLHPVGSACHIVNYFSCSVGLDAVSTKSALGHFTLNLCFCNRWDLRVT